MINKSFAAKGYIARSKTICLPFPFCPDRKQPPSRLKRKKRYSGEVLEKQMNFSHLTWNEHE